MSTIVVLGASKNPNRASNKAIKILKKSNNFRVIPVHPTEKEIEGLSVVSSLDDIKEYVDILSVYVQPKIFETLLDHVADLMPGYVILNPETESPIIEMGLEKRCISYHKICTIVALKQGKL